ncbi:hypothetical protein PIB30_029462 [Stylosanthes scabra]|uniref:Uncharacterized protein n=1 Tax=Stylosanthes scabra TaxID=79078 RepID=A0ABU6Z9Z9_9FABA|nr:hypothetical protein [Stylosanthes scabra]
MGCVNRLHTEFSSHREILHHGDGRSRRVHFDQLEQTLGSSMAVDMLGCMTTQKPEVLSQSSSMLNYGYGEHPKTSCFIHCHHITEASSSFRFDAF